MWPPWGHMPYSPTLWIFTRPQDVCSTIRFTMCGCRMKRQCSVIWLCLGMTGVEYHVRMHGSIIVCIILLKLWKPITHTRIQHWSGSLQRTCGFMDRASAHSEWNGRSMEKFIRLIMRLIVELCGCFHGVAFHAILHKRLVHETMRICGVLEGFWVCMDYVAYFTEIRLVSANVFTQIVMDVLPIDLIS